MTVNELCKECLCGTKLYAAFAKLNHILAEMNDKGLERRSALSKRLATILSERELLDPPSNELICHPALVINEMWGESYNALCRELGLSNLAIFKAPSDSERSWLVSGSTYSIPFGSVCPLHPRGNPVAPGRDSDGWPAPDNVPTESDYMSQVPEPGGLVSVVESSQSGYVLADGRTDQPNNSASLIPTTSLDSRYTSLHLFADIAARYPEYTNAPTADTHAQTPVIDSTTRLSGATSTSPQCSEAQTLAESIQADQSEGGDENDGLDDLVQWSQPEFPAVSAELQILVSNTYISNPQNRRRKQLHLQGKDPPPTAYKLLEIPPRVKTIRNLAVREMAPKLLETVQGQLRWTWRLIHLVHGGLYAQMKTYKTIVLSFKTCKYAPTPQIQFDWGNEKEVAECRDLSTLAIVEGPVTFRTVGHPLILLVLQFYKEEAWPWLADNQRWDETDDSAVSEISDCCAMNCTCRTCGAADDPSPFSS
ncbi:hypothetical protein PG994_004265 [Apiospora phragmitis]|uniref:Uncharacterized protein n=1 Tax=Apiospora phragmitis TaxID=2905665 RepID=A0ABR1VQ40_9PEZI